MRRIALVLTTISLIAGCAGNVPADADRDLDGEKFSALSKDDQVFVALTVAVLAAAVAAAQN